MTSLLYALIILLPVVTLAEEFHLRYFVNVTMDCDEDNHNLTITASISRKYWLLPSGQLLDGSMPKSEHIKINDTDNASLTVNRINDVDFGKYYCFIVLADHTLVRIEHGVNVDGAYYGDLLEKYRSKAIVGGIAAGILFAVVTSFCLAWHVRDRAKSKRNKAVDALDKAIDGYDLKAYDNVAIEPDSKAELPDGVTELDQKM